MQGLYAISDEKLVPYNKILNMIEESFIAGVRFFQLRDKHSSLDTLKYLSREIMSLCQKYDVCFILNDYYELALQLECGVHLGKDEMCILKSHYNMQEIQDIFKKLSCVGISCYGSLELAQEAYRLGADYIAFGSCFDSPTKPHAQKIDINIFNEAKNILDMPLCAIGGITPYNMQYLSNVDMIAVISSLWSGDIKKNVADFMLYWSS